MGGVALALNFTGVSSLDEVGVADRVLEGACVLGLRIRYLLLKKGGSEYLGSFVRVRILVSRLLKFKWWSCPLFCLVPDDRQSSHNDNFVLTT